MTKRHGIPKKERHVFCIVLYRIFCSLRIHRAAERKQSYFSRLKMLEQTVHSLRERPEEIDRLVVDLNAVHKGSEIGIIGIVAIDHTGKCGDRSGEIEIRRIGELLKRTSAGRQILCITHTAQIAAFADRHLLIQKKVEQGRTFTEIEPLDENGRVHALAKIIYGDHITDLSLANAKEMIETARMTPQKKYTG